MTIDYCCLEQIARDLVRFLGSITANDLDSSPQSPFFKPPVLPTALPSMVDDEDDLTPLPQGIHSHSQSSGSVLKMNPRHPITRMSSSDKLQTLWPHSVDKTTGRGRSSSEERSTTNKGLVSPRKIDTPKQSDGPDGSHHIMFR